ncbi:hypothetical protein TELCIR_17944, partial [Teladorsagia circumcincta]
MLSMNLFMPGEGLYGTHVTWEDIEKDMQHELGTSSPFGSHKSAKDIGEGKGFMSKVLLVDADWQHKEKKLPEKFVLKIATPLAWMHYTAEISKQQNSSNDFCKPSAMERFEAILKRAHNAEVSTYTHLAKLPEGKINIPKIYCTRKFSEANLLKGYIAMEYIENTNEREFSKVLRYTAVLEAASLDVSLKERMEFFEAPFQTMCTGLLQKTHLTADSTGVQRVLCHGDICPTNTFWKQTGGSIELAAVIDYQTAHFGCSATDLVQIFVTFLSGKDRRAHWEQLIEDFYGYLKQEVGNRRVPYTLDQ